MILIGNIDQTIRSLRPIKLILVGFQLLLRSYISIIKTAEWSVLLSSVMKYKKIGKFMSKMFPGYFQDHEEKYVERDFY